MARPVITLTTDFGQRDSYVAAMKGVILSLAPDVALVDVTHEVSPQDIREASYALQSVYRYFPASAVHVAVVDPGVGTDRKPVAIQAEHGRFVGPDNGLFSPVLAEQGALAADTGAVLAAVAVELSAPDYRLPVVSRTFHGRDIFAPAAAHIARGVALERLGPRLDRLTCLTDLAPRVEAGALHGRVVHIDGFGNAVTNVTSGMVSEDQVVVAGGVRIEGLSSTYQDRDIGALIGSTGALEIAVRNGNAAERLGIRVGDEVLVCERA